MKQEVFCWLRGWGGGGGEAEARQVRALYEAGSFLFSCLLLLLKKLIFRFL